MSVFYFGEFFLSCVGVLLFYGSWSSCLSLSFRDCFAPAVPLSSLPGVPHGVYWPGSSSLVLISGCFCLSFPVLTPFVCLTVGRLSLDVLPSWCRCEASLCEEGWGSPDGCPPCQALSPSVPVRPVWGVSVIPSEAHLLCLLRRHPVGSWVCWVPPEPCGGRGADP